MTALPKNPLATLDDEIVERLPALLQTTPEGPSLRLIAEELAADYASVRAAAFRLNADGRADVMRRLNSRELYLVPIKYRKSRGLAHCAICEACFDRGDKRSGRSGRKRYTHYNDRRTCSRKCWGALSWRGDGVHAKRCAALHKSQSTPEAVARTKRTNAKRWARPGERKKMSEQNRRLWADPIGNAIRSQAIAKAARKPERRKKDSERRKAAWANPETRKKMLAGMEASHRVQAYRASASERMRARWRDPKWRKKWMKAVRRNSAKAAAKNRGRKQPAAQIAKRVASTRETNVTKGRWKERRQA